VDQIEYRAYLSKLYMMSQMLEDIPLHEMIASAEKGITLGPVSDPTLYMKKSGAPREDLEIMRSFVGVKDVMDKMTNERGRREENNGDR